MFLGMLSPTDSTNAMQIVLDTSKISNVCSAAWMLFEISAYSLR